ncbi:MAG: asparagine synthase (glutamine-hydrolyzing) [Syntrophomonas sp.]
MCGIAGFLNSRKNYSNEQIDMIINNMSAQLKHRGPDSGGFWVDAEAGIALGHRRLAIIDLSPEGNQPMVSNSGRYIVVFNGEIYNFLELRNILISRGCTFKGSSDTEVLLAAVESWGVDKALRCFSGMFAFALWDTWERQLILARDRIGEKPLYYGWSGYQFLFASELKSFRAHPEFTADINRDSLALFMRHGYVPAPYSIYTGIYKLIPGTYMVIDPENSGYYPEPVFYWSLKEAAETGLSNPYNGDENEAVERLDQLLKEVVKQQMIADVPLGAFLSGGIDSSTIVALMQTQSNLPVKTFSIGFHEQAYNEAQYAKRVAQQLGTEHTELYITPQAAIDVIPKLPFLYDEPFADSSQIPTHLVATLAGKHVTVSLSGDGGDEIFGGYNRYFWGTNIWNRIGWMPQMIRSAGANTIRAISPLTWDRLFKLMLPLLPRKFNQRLPGDKIHKLAEVLTVPDADAMYLMLVSTWKQPDQLVLSSTEPLTALTDPQRWARIYELTQRMMYLDSISYLPDDILVKVDRACMGVSLESRVPFLNHQVIEFAWQLPLSMKINHGQGKYILRRVLRRYIPDNLIERPKMGFGVPIDSWLRGPLKKWAEDLLDVDRLKSEGYLSSQSIHEKWEQHLSGKRNWQHHIWNILMFQAWLETHEV